MTVAEPRSRLRPYVRPENRRAGEPAAPAARWSLEWMFFALVVAAWSFTPLVRRLIDYHNGAFNPVQIASLIPYLALLPLTVVCFRRDRLARMAPPLRLMAWIWLGAFAYGFLLGFAAGDTGAAAFELVQYLIPPLGGLWLAGQPLPLDRAFRRLTWILMPCAAVIAVYGLLQWVGPPPWDVMWVKGNDFVIVGPPEPFAMRVFSTLNSPGTAADFFAVIMLMMLPWLRLRSVWVWPLLSVLGAALLLTLTREAWVALVVGIAAFLIASPRRIATAPMLGVYAVVMIVLAVTVPPLLGSRNADVITSRISTLTDVGHDTSALDRQAEIRDALDQGLSNPIGSGLGVFGSASKLSSNPQLVVGNILDSGYLARLIELGWAGMLAYLAVVIGGPILLAYRIFRSKSGLSVDARVAGAVLVSVCAALAWGDAADDAHFGLDGFLFWIALGLGSLALRSNAPPVEAVRNGLGRTLR